MPRIILRVGTFLMIVAAASLLPLKAQAFDCQKSSGGCTVSISTSIWTGTPTVFCNAPYHVVRIEVTPVCGLCEGLTQSFLRCGSSNTAIQFTGCGHTHTLSLPYDGDVWEGTLTSCDGIVYTVQ